ncbi:MAG: CPBP family intramembrane metalloprotease [Candidatus Zixiibacteriota bacterium]|nr:MAG: CPBP family intramembrane metalloprotease [candidate division Zixibacteria bacterium]
MSKLTVWVRQHQVTAFYLLVFGISWPAMILFFRLPPNSGIQAPFGLIATFCPVLAAMIISTIANSSPKEDRKASRWFVFLGAWLFSWAVISLHTWQIRGMEPTLQVIIPAGMVAILPGWLFSCALSRRPGVRQLFKTLLKPRGHFLWYLVALGAVPAVQLIGAGLTALAGGEIGFDLPGTGAGGTFAILALTFFQGFLVAGGINEETGWRGFVLPRLQSRYPVIGAIVVVWFFWALWHIPYDIGNGTPLQSLLVNRVVFNFIWAVLFAWVYNRTRGSLLAPALCHPAMNTFGNTLPRTDITTALFVLLAAGIIYFERMWKKLPKDNPAVHP